MRTIFLLLTLFLFTLDLFSQENKKEELKGFDAKEINNIINKANKVYDTASIESELIVPKSVDLASELQNLKEYKDLKNKLVELETERKNKFSQDIESYKLKYKTALSIIDDIVADSKKLEVQYKTIKIYSDFSKNANPTEYKVFNDNLTSLKSDKFKANIELPDIKISNPYISIAYSMIGGIFSKNKKRVEIIEKMMCITDFTMDFKTDLKSIDNQITYLSSSASNLSIKGEAIFTKLGRTLNYSETYTNYRKDIIVNGLEDPLKTFRTSYFDNISNRAGELGYEVGNASEIRNMELNFMLVVDYIKSYEILLFEGLSYYNSFIEIVKKYEEPNDRYGCIDQNETRIKFKDMITKLEEARNLYSNAYLSVVSTSDKLKFYFGATSN